MARFFVSYTSKDRDWAFWLAEELKALGHQPHIHEEEVRGTNFLRWMREQVRDADNTLCVISPDYLDPCNKHSQEEFDAARNRAIKSDPGFCRMVVVRSSQIDELDSTTNYKVLAGLMENDARAKLKDFLSDISPGAVSDSKFVPFPGSVQHNLPFSAPWQFFQRDKAELFGREDFFEKIEVCYTGSRHRPATVALRGMVGCGKSTIAAAYAHAHFQRYRTCWWIHAATEGSIRLDLAKLAVRLRWAGLDDGDDFPVESVLKKLETHGRGLLLIYDNAEGPMQLEKYLPQTGDSHILITSNAPNWGRIAEEYEVTTWSPETGGEFLIKRVQNGADRSSAEKLSNEFGGLPLALEMAGAYCAAHGLTLKKYGALAKSKIDQVFGSTANAPQAYHDHRPAAVAFELAMQPATKRHQAASELLLHLSLLGPEPIPLFMFEEGAAALPQGLQSTLVGGGVDNAIRALSEFALIQRPGDDENETAAASDVELVQLNRALRAIVPAKLSPSEDEAIRATLIRMLELTYPSADMELNPAWDRARLLGPHMDHLLDEKRTLPRGCETAAADMIHRAVHFIGPTHADLQKAERLIDRSLALRREFAPADKLRIADILGTKALLSLVRDCGDTSGQAVKLSEDAVNLLEETVGPNDSRYAMSLITLARVLRDKFDPNPTDVTPDPESLTRAASLCEQSLRILGPAATMDRAHALSVYGRVLSRQKRLESARAAVTEALGIYERLCSKVHPAQARNAVDMAEIMIREGAYEAAREMLDRARAVYAQDDHFQYGFVLCDGMQAWLEKAQGRFDEAQGRHEKAQEHLKMAHALIERALDLAQKVHGQDHTKTKALRVQLRALSGPPTNP